MNSRSFGYLVLCVVLPLSVEAGDWPQYRGPERTGILADEGLATRWSGDGPTELWRRPVGPGYSAISVAAGRLYTLAAEAGQEWVLSFDAAAGDEVWRRPLGPSKDSDMDDDGPRSTPTVVDGMVYAISSSALLVALSAEDGRLVWQRDLQAEGPAPRFGYSVSPLVDGDQVIVEAGGSGDNPGIYAFDRQSGALRWTALAGPAGYSSPIVVEISGRRQYVFFRRVDAAVVGLSPEGETLWQHPTAGLAIITTPIFLPPDRIFVASADDGFGGLMLSVRERDGGFETEELWTQRLMRNHFSTSVAIGDHLYGFDNGTFRCVDAATGEVRWAKRGLGKGSLVASGKSLFVLGDDGTLVLVAANPEAYVENGRVQAMSGRAWTSPSLADGRLYLRDFDELVSYDLRAPEPPAEPAVGEGR